MLELRSGLCGCVEFPVAVIDQLGAHQAQLEAVEVVEVVEVVNSRRVKDGVARQKYI